MWNVNTLTREHLRIFSARFSLWNPPKKPRSKPTTYHVQSNRFHIEFESNVKKLYKTLQHQSNFWYGLLFDMNFYYRSISDLQYRHKIIKKITVNYQYLAYLARRRPTLIKVKTLGQNEQQKRRFVRLIYMERSLVLRAPRLGAALTRHLSRCTYAV